MGGTLRVVSAGLTGNQVQYDPTVEEELRLLGLKDAEEVSPTKPTQDSSPTGDDDADTRDGLGRLIEFLSKKKVSKKQGLSSCSEANYALRAYQSLDEIEYQLATQGTRLDRKI